MLKMNNKFPCLLLTLKELILGKFRSLLDVPKYTANTYILLQYKFNLPSKEQAWVHTGLHAWLIVLCFYFWSATLLNSVLPVIFAFNL